ncbi:LINE-1 retrotransposable element ORF1 protein [Anabarilius grahami]|uniref:LINE-1 retrotransposable element ORF1 protein n=1 Tax=Anabarilius grahami TaxID=495550 RepID=A0A3N0YIV6_ANAGA|nr:LINE-1 retrotransposable element ORF1 protein [Anabarilius grahami]
MESEAVASAAISRADITALLAEHRTALVAELKATFFDEVNGKLDGLQKASDSHDERLTSLEDDAETLHQHLAKLDRAHRGLTPKPGPGERPRPVIICFHRYQNKDLLIREARKRGELKYLDQPFRIYEDYIPEVVAQRKVYKLVMLDLYKMGLRPSLLYPARLRITKTDGTRSMFGSVAEAEKFVKNFKTD